MKISHFLSAAMLGLSATITHAATIWEPTNNDTDFLQFDFFGITTNGGILGLFDENDFGGTALVIGSAGGQVSFAANGSDIEATFSGDNSSILLGGSDSHFTLGMSWDGGMTWFADSASMLTGGSPDTYEISFSGVIGNTSLIEGKTIGVDLQPIPVPAAVWLFGSGLIGMVGIARRSA